MPQLPVFWTKQNCWNQLKVELRPPFPKNHFLAPLANDPSYHHPLFRLTFSCWAIEWGYSSPSCSSSGHAVARGTHQRRKVIKMKRECWSSSIRAPRPNDACSCMVLVRRWRHPRRLKTQTSFPPSLTTYKSFLLPSPRGHCPMSNPYLCFPLNWSSS